MAIINMAANSFQHEVTPTSQVYYEAKINSLTRKL